MIEPTPVRPMGTMHNGQVHGVTAVDGDDMTWDWWQALGETGYFTVGPNGGIEVGKVAPYDTRPHPERLEHVITELVQRIEALEKTIRDWSGD